MCPVRLTHWCITGHSAVAYHEQDTPSSHASHLRKDQSLFLVTPKDKDTEQSDKIIDILMELNYDSVAPPMNGTKDRTQSGGLCQVLLSGLSHVGMSGGGSRIGDSVGSESVLLL